VVPTSRAATLARPRGGWADRVAREQPARSQGVLAAAGCMTRKGRASGAGR
jgi:hypothetical protein